MGVKMYKHILASALGILLFVASGSAQWAEGTLSLNETFFNTLLDSVFQNFDPLEFPTADNQTKRDAERLDRRANVSSYMPFSPSPRRGRQNAPCRESVRVLREMNGVKTAVRFRDGKILVPLAFSGNYSPPFIGCVEMAGWAETNIDLEFDTVGKRLVGRARVLNVNLNGTGGIGGTVIARLIQRSIDKKLNPIELIRLDKLSGAFPMPNGGDLRVKAISARAEVLNEILKIHVTYQFLKS